MTDVDFICGLMRANTNSVGFITRPTVEKRFVPHGHYVIQRDRFRRPIGYLIHGPVHPDGHCQIHQACIELDRRSRHFGQVAVETMIARAIAHGAETITLRCATDLDAVHFWAALGFWPYAIQPGGKRRRRQIVKLALDVRDWRPPSTAFPPPAIAAELTIQKSLRAANLLPSVHTIRSEGGPNLQKRANSQPAALPHPPTLI